jgi:anti-sigma regulatory factor (Ser/Thr protein kinase)/putative methionine-R-sulfoxide reductase with GAF domain
VLEHIIPAETTAEEPVPRIDLATASLDHLRRIQSVTDAALANLGVDDLLEELLIRVREALSTDTAAILLLDRTKGELVARAAKGIEEEVKAGVRIPVGRGFAGTIAATGKPVFIPDVDHSIVLNPILREKGIHSLLGVPLVAQGQTLGVLHVGTLVPRDFTSEDTALLQMVGDRVALAVNAGLYERERAVARMLQASLLPETLPNPPGLRLAARYRPARGGEVGGDWYDAFMLLDGSIAVAIGDVVGHGLGAAAAMGRLKNALRAYAVELDSPSQVLDRLDRLLQGFHPGEMATVIYGVIDPVALTLRYASAAHLPPIVRDGKGTTKMAEMEVGPPLGAVQTAAFPDQVQELRPGSTLIMYTDGLIERRGESLDVGLRRLREACRAELSAEELCDHVLEELIQDGETADDVAVVAVEVLPDPGDRIHLSLPAEVGQLVTLRRVLQRWLTQRGVDPTSQYDVVSAVGEAAANAIEHSYGPSGGVLRVSGHRSSSDLVMTVRDFGQWRSGRAPERGRGIPMMEALTDEIRIDRSDTGTTVELRWREWPRR